MIAKVEEPELLIEVGLNPAEAPEGSPLTVMPTFPLNPLRAWTETV
jgi:hypothetical protein